VVAVLILVLASVIVFKGLSAIVYGCRREYTERRALRRELASEVEEWLKQQQ
jgi:hypothetical protein